MFCMLKEALYLLSDFYYLLTRESVSDVFQIFLTHSQNNNSLHRFNVITLALESKMLTLCVELNVKLKKQKKQ